MKLWIDDVRPAPAGYVWCKSVGQTKQLIRSNELRHETIELLDIDHDAGDFAFDGGDFIKLLDWMEFTNRNFPIRIQTFDYLFVNYILTYYLSYDK